ncbi:unnamed protein product [Trichobilharzia szidati]|nr:unnamed protein product [Trichobilharzia szidati]
MIEKSIYRKETWTGQYLHYNSFCPISYKRGLVRTLYDRARKLCSPNKVEEELDFIEKCLRENGYPKGFIQKYSREKDKKEKHPTVEKKKVFICLPFKGDAVSQKIDRRLKGAINRSFPAAKLITVYNTTPSMIHSKLDKYPADVTSNCVYEFTCTCGSKYIGRTERRASIRFSEHIPRNLCLKGSKYSQSAITRHIVDTGHLVEISKSFKILNRQRTANLLRFAEAIAIKRFKPDLCIQKESVINLSLPW